MQHFEEEPRLSSLSSLVGEIVQNGRGEQLGELRDVIIDLDAGCVAYAVLSFGGFLGLGNRRFVVPWKLLSLHEEEGFLLNLPRSELDRVPSFDSDHWPDVSDRAWGREVHRYFHADPYWETASSSASSKAHD